MTTQAGPSGNTEHGYLGKRPLRIALLSEFAYPFHKGGAERRYYELGSRLAARGHDVHWFAMRHWPGDRSISFQGMQLHAVSDSVDVYAPSGGRSISAGLRVAWALTKALSSARSRFDVLDCSLYPFFHIFGARIVKPGTLTVVSWYEFWGDHWYEYLGWRGFFGKRVEVLASRVVHRIICVSELAAKGLASAGVPEGRVAIVPLGVDTARMEAIPTLPESFDVVSFGRLKNHKNIDLLLHALVHVRRTRPNVSCAVIGDGPERERLERLVSDLKLDRNVRFHGEIEDEAKLFGLVKASKIFVNPSTKEGGGSLTLLEANACGVPTIAIRHELGIDASLIQAGRNGWWADRAEPEVLGRTIARALDAIEGSDGRPRWAECCREFARAYDWDEMTARCEEIYLEALNRG